MRILGLSFGFHDAGACMLDYTDIEFAGHSERYSKQKNDPWINHELIDAAIEGGKPDVIVLHEKAWAKKARNFVNGNWRALQEPTQRWWLKKFYLKFNFFKNFNNLVNASKLLKIHKL